MNDLAQRQYFNKTDATLVAGAPFFFKKKNGHCVYSDWEISREIVYFSGKRLLIAPTHKY